MTSNNNTTELIWRAYSAFNARDIDEAVASMQPDVEWANWWEGGYVQGHDALRDYWTRQWQELNPNVTPVAINVDGDSVDVLVDQVVRAADGSLISSGRVKHHYRLRNGLIARMDIMPVARNGPSLGPRDVRGVREDPASARNRLHHPSCQGR
jgi:ketosteroid isomerase-like protein